MAKTVSKKTQKKKASKKKAGQGKTKPAPKKKTSGSAKKIAGSAKRTSGSAKETAKKSQRPGSSFKVEKVQFESAGEMLGGTFYLPNSKKAPPVIVMGHGFAAVQSFALPEFAARFAGAGYAVFTFDYRTFGESAGEPRHIVHPWDHQADFRAALEFVRTDSRIDPLRVILWGSSYAGGHVVALGAERQPVKAVISQVPHLDAIVTVLNLSPFTLVKAVFFGLRDLIGKALGLRPHYSKVVGRPGEFAAMSSPEAYDGYYAMIPSDSAWENKFASRAFIYTTFYSPIRVAKRVGAPTLLIGSTGDTITPVKAHRRAAKLIPGCEYHELDSNHFDPYRGEMFETNIRLQLDFLAKTVPV